LSRLSVAADTIKNNVSALDVAEALGLDVDRHGRCACPFHNGKDRNLKLFPGNRGYTCFVCHHSGDVISFVREYNGMLFKDAIAWFDRTFNLGLNLDQKIDPAEQIRAEMALQRRRERHELLEWKKQMQFKLALLADRMVEKLEEERDEYRPRTYGAWDERFVTAVKLLPEARRFAEECEINCTEVKEK